MLWLVVLCLGIQAREQNCLKRKLPKKSDGWKSNRKLTRTQSCSQVIQSFSLEHRRANASKCFIIAKIFFEVFCFVLYSATTLRLLMIDGSASPLGVTRRWSHISREEKENSKRSLQIRVNQAIECRNLKRSRSQNKVKEKRSER
jgi:hypothetical protein